MPFSISEHQMALLSDAEKKKLARQGYWVREKCDHCGAPILIPITVTIQGKMWCVPCGNRWKEERRMEKAGIKRYPRRAPYRFPRRAPYRFPRRATKEIMAKLAKLNGKK